MNNSQIRIPRTVAERVQVHRYMSVYIAQQLTMSLTIFQHRNLRSRRPRLRVRRGQFREHEVSNLAVKKLLYLEEIVIVALSHGLY